MSFICDRCKNNMCDDCREIAEEYEQLLINWKRSHSELESRNVKLQQELNNAKTRLQFVDEDLEKMFLNIRTAFASMRGEVRSKEQVLHTLDVIRPYLLGEKSK